jgi:hypothetical protein
MQKILFWIDANLVHLFIAKIMKERNEFDLYAIFDQDTLDKTLYNEDKTTFKKKWFFWDHVKKDYKPDLTYLKKIEEKYEISLWRIAYTERVFFNNYYHLFSRTEILGIIEQECKLFEEILEKNKPDFLIMRMYDWHRIFLLKEMCKKHGVKVLLLMGTRSGNRVTTSSTGTSFDELIHEQDGDYTKIDFENVKDLFIKNSRSAQVKKRKSGYDTTIFNKMKMGSKFIKNFNSNYSESYDHYGATRWKIIIYRIKKTVWSKYRKRFVDKNSIFPKENEKFVLLPFHVEPERTITTDADFFADQISLVEKISKSLPVGYFLYVKENPMMKVREWRKIKDYKRILKLPNVRLIHYSVDSLSLIRKCELVITIAGTAGLEAAILEKPSMVFTKVDYEWMSCVTQIKNWNMLSSVIKKSLKTKVDRDELKKLYNFYVSNTFEFDAVEMDNKTLEKFYDGGYVMSDKIHVKKINEFIKENKNVLEKLTNEHVKKISWWNNQ